MKTKLNPANTKTAILWDLDGTLVDSLETHYLAWELALKDIPNCLTRAVHEAHFGTSNRASILDFLPAPLPEEQLQVIIAQKETYFRQLSEQSLLLFPGAKECLAHFHALGFPQAIASSGSMASIEKIVDQTEIRPYFNGLFSGSDIPPKPDPGIFLLAARSLGHEPKSCIVIEDSPFGLQAGKAAGMTTIAKVRTHRAGQKPAFVDDCFTDYDENFIALLGQLLSV